MQSFDFDKLHSLIGKYTNDINSKGFFDSIQSDYIDYFIIHEPEKEDIERENDNWKCYESQKLGIVIEAVDEFIVCVSFLSGGSIFDEPNDIPVYPYDLYNNLRLCTKRDEVVRIFGRPKKETEFFDQYEIENDITMGILYNQKNKTANTISFGLTEIFSNPEKIPNRYSLIFMSLS
jgi:hypothetical protein